MHFALIGRLVGLAQFTSCHSREMSIQLFPAIKLKMLFGNSAMYLRVRTGLLRKTGCCVIAFATVVLNGEDVSANNSAVFPSNTSMSFYFGLQYCVPLADL